MNDNEETKTSLSYLIYESSLVRLERINRRLWITNLVKDAILVIIVCGFLLYLNQYDYSSYNYDYKQNSDGINIIGNENGVDYDVTETTHSEENTKKESK